MGRFFEDFCMSCENRDFTKIVVFPMENCIFKGSRFQKSIKINEKNDVNLELKNTSQKISSSLDFGRVLDSIWEGVGSLVGRIWRLLGLLGLF